MFRVPGFGFAWIFVFVFLGWRLGFRVLGEASRLRIADFGLFGVYV